MQYWRLSADAKNADVNDCLDGKLLTRRIYQQALLFIYASLKSSYILLVRVSYK